MPSSAESVERLLLFQTLAALVMFTAGSLCNQPSRACCAEVQAAPRRPEVERYCTQRQAQHVGHPEADGRVVERVHVGYLDLERQLEHRLVDRLLHHLGHRCGLLPFCYHDRDASTAWAVAPGRAARGCDASCLGIEAWWGILAVSEATQSTAAPECASRARHCGRCLSGAHGACRALEANGLAAHVHEAAGRARHTSAQPLRARNSAWIALCLLRAGRWRKVARLGLHALTGASEAGGGGVCALRARQHRTGTLGAEEAGLAGNARLLALAGLVRACRALVAGALLRDGLDGARAAVGLLGAARRRGVARVGLGALVLAAQVCCLRIRALLARQRRAGARWAVRAGLAGSAPFLALVGLVRACRAPVARTLACDGLDGARATLGLLGAARRRKVALARRCALVSAGEVGGVGVRALLARQRRAGARRAIGAGLAGNARLLALAGLVLAGRAPDARGHARVWRDGAGAAHRLPCATGWRKVALGSRRAFRLNCEVGGVGVRARLARQRCAGALGAVRARLAGDARLLALAGLVLASGAPVAEGSARGGRNEAGGAVPTVGWVVAPTNRIGLPRSARLARRAVVLAAVWVERAGGARRERLPQARRSFCRTRAAAWTVAAHGRLDVLAQLARRAGGAARASLVRVVGPGRARNAACLHQAGDPDWQVCSGRTREWLNACIRAELAAAVALATALGVGLDRFVAIVASRALVRAAGEVLVFVSVCGRPDQRRWRDPQAERAVDEGILS
eukprot:scaffold17321_cov70-Phaeocystis_antarctica.AAC.3